MNRKLDLKSKIFGVALLLMMLSSPVVAQNQTVEFEAFSGTVDSNGDLVKTDTNIQGYSAVVYNFDSNSFSDATDFYTEKETSGSNMTLNFNITDEKENYGIYFFKRDSNGEDSYITYEYTIELNESGNNLDEIDSTQYNDKIYFTRKTGAESTIEIDQFDELAAGEPVTVGVDIRVDAPIDETYVTDYVPNNEFGQENLTEFYRTEVQYDLEALNLTSGSVGSTVDSKTDTVSLEFGGSKDLEFTTIEETGYYNITGETDPTVDSKIESGTISTDYEEVRYLSKIDSYAEPNEAFTREDPFEAELYVKKDTFSGINEADILDKFEYTWVQDTPLDGEQGLDAASSTTNVSFDNSQESLPVNVSKSEEGDWYLCHRAYVEDTRSIITKGKTSCNHYMIDRTPPQITNIFPTRTVTYKEDGNYFNATISDNIHLEEAILEIDGAQVFKTNSFSDIDGSNSVSTSLNLAADSYNWEWQSRDKVMFENDITATSSSGSITINPLAPNLDLRVENQNTGNTVNEAYWNDKVEINVSTDTESAPLGFSSNYTLWTPPSDGTEKGSYSAEITLDQTGIFNFEASAGENNENYTVETASQTVKVKEIPTNADITLLDDNDNEISSAGLMETVTVRLDPQADQKNSKAPVKGTSNLTLSAWNEINENGVYEKDIQMKQEGTFEFNMTAGDTGTNNEGFTNSSDSETLTVSSTNGGGETLEWNLTIQDQEIHKSEAFNYRLGVNYTGTSSDLTWNTLNDNFTVSTGTTPEHANVSNSSSLEKGIYKVPIEVYDSKGSYLTAEFNVTITEDLYWSVDPGDESINEGTDYSRDLTSNVEYIGDKSNLTWNITENRDLFNASNGVVQDRKTLDPGTYTIGVNVSDDSDRKIKTSYTLTVNQVNTGGNTGTSNTFTTTTVPEQEPKELNISLSRNRAATGVEIGVSGTLTNSEGTENITVEVQGEQKAVAQVDSNGDYQASFITETTGKKTVKASTEGLEASKTLEVVGPANFTSIEYPDIVEPGEQFTICAQTEREAQISLERTGNVTNTKLGTDICFNETVETTGYHSFNITATSDGRTVKETVTVQGAYPTSEGTVFESSDPADTDEGDTTGTGGLTGAFTRATSGTSGKIGFSVLTGLIITLAIILGL